VIWLDYDDYIDVNYKKDRALAIPWSEISRLLAQVGGHGKFATRFNVAAGSLHLEFRINTSISIQNSKSGANCSGAWWYLVDVSGREGIER
jgi:hypothetical protein